MERQRVSDGEHRGSNVAVNLLLNEKHSQSCHDLQDEHPNHNESLSFAW